MEESKQKTKSLKYRWWNDKKMSGVIMLVLSVCFLVFSYLEIPGPTTIHAYTIGMLLGFYAPLFYAFVIYKALLNIFGNNIKLPGWVHFTDITYWFFVASVVFISTSLGYYQSKAGFTTIGSSSWKSFDTWFNAFTNNQTESFWTPRLTNGGVVGAFLFAITAMCFTGVGSLILAITVLIVSISLLLTGTFIGLYKDIIKKKRLELRQKEIVQEKKTKISSFEDEQTMNDYKEKNNLKPEEDENDSLPFDDPF